MGVFDSYDDESFPHRFKGSLLVPTICGGIPSNPNVANAWLKSRMGLDNDAALMQAVMDTMAAREITIEEATAVVNQHRHLNGFKRFHCPDCPVDGVCDISKPHQLYIEGRQLKAALKEAVSVAAAADKLDMRGWGVTKKWLTTFFPEHAFVVEVNLPLKGALHASGTIQRFVSTHRGTGIQYEEYVTDAEIDFTVITDYDFTEKDWAMIWTTGQRQGIGATRSQGYGRYEVTRWDRISGPAKKRVSKAVAAEDEDEAPAKTKVTATPAKIAAVKATKATASRTAA
jgi:hypothetical protein